MYSKTSVVGIKLLLDSSTPDATHDSAARSPAPQCFPGTRTQYIKDVTSWALNRDHSPYNKHPPVLWVKGPAGTSVEHVKDAGCLGASFFFSSLHARDDPRRLFTSLAYQISTISQPYRDILDNKIRRDETVLSKSMAWQFEELIASPLRELSRNGLNLGEKAVFIDGLDECTGTDVQVEIIQIILTSVQCRSTPFRWALFSRAEPHIEASFSRVDVSSLSFHVISIPVSRAIDREIKAFLRYGFQEILRRHNLSAAPQWPTEAVLDILVNASAGLFIYAATVLRFVGKSNLAGPEELLQMVVSAINTGSEMLTTGVAATNPFEALDTFYLLIMHQIPDNMLLLVRCLILLASFAPETEHGGVAMQLGNLLGTSEMKFTLVCNKLHAVLQFQDHHRRSVRHDVSWPSGLNCINHLQNTRGEPARLAPLSVQLGGSISFYHKSFVDFVTDPSRSGRFCARTPAVANTLFARCLRLHHDFTKSYVFPHIELQSLLLPSDTLPPWDTPQHRLSFLHLSHEVTSSASSLKWFYQDECLNAFLKVHVYRLVVDTIVQLHLSFDLDHSLLQQLEDIDYRQMFRIYSTGDEELDIHLLIGWERKLKDITGGDEDAGPYTQLFGAIQQRLPSELKQHGKIIRRYTPNFVTKWKSLLGSPLPRGGTILYVLGHGEHKLYLCQSKFTEYLASDPYRS
ncbi:hypothetical protein AN958_10036 [Leucoagaricus sp. SymC.cos]|nr:hypothetical protein AN958_10036 [Leucoagaricus sp. SymC.cos]